MPFRPDRDPQGPPPLDRLRRAVLRAAGRSRVPLRRQPRIARRQRGRRLPAAVRAAPALAGARAPALGGGRRGALRRPAPQPLLVGACNAIELLAVVAVLHGRNGFSSPRYGREQLPRLLLAAGAVPILTSAAAAAFIQAEGGMPFRAQWLTWYPASMLAYVSLTPMLLSLRLPEPRPQQRAMSIGEQVAGITLIARPAWPSRGRSSIRR
ncbi:hypothetical protein HK414_10520 [Ramlibacter terrae]|uniref:Cation-transporting P-type ATPase C-terminal domain-containing protein n=1 Tax=Ramlibacter terrae TaxID=2732511 RepID=A0ABX6P231_9BURK|nr:hypothetical protein HK414_10520 [Ramlibacter terrae]